jgi:hypothetical protein
METVKGDEDPGSSPSDEEEDEDRSDTDEGIASKGDITEERVESVPDASAEDHGLDATARRANRGVQVAAIARLSPAEDPLEERLQSSTGSGILPAIRSASVETGLRNLEVSEGDVPEEGERTLVLFPEKPMCHSGF